MAGNLREGEMEEGGGIVMRRQAGREGGRQAAGRKRIGWSERSEREGRGRGLGSGELRPQSHKE